MPNTRMVPIVDKADQPYDLVFCSRQSESNVTIHRIWKYKGNTERARSEFSDDSDKRKVN